MKQNELFEIEPIEPKSREMKKMCLGRDRIAKRKIESKIVQPSLLDAMNVEKKKKGWILTFSRKTEIFVPCDLTVEQCLELEKKYKGEDGKIKHESTSEWDIFGGIQNRR